MYQCYFQFFSTYSQSVRAKKKVSASIGPLQPLPPSAQPALQLYSEHGCVLDPGGDGSGAGRQADRATPCSRLCRRRVVQVNTIW